MHTEFVNDLLMALRRIYLNEHQVFLTLIY